MIKYQDGTVFNSGVKTVVNTVNCFGVMGTGIALEFSIRYPEMFDKYKEECVNKEYRVGTLKSYIVHDMTIINFPTKNHWKYPSKIEYIIEGLKYFRDNYKSMNITEVAFPKLGTLNGGLEWYVVKREIEKYLSDLDIDIIVCLNELNYPEGDEKKMVDKFNKISIEELSKNIKLTSKQIESLENIQPISRFWNILKAPAIGEKSYCKIFRYFLNDISSTNIKSEQFLLDL